MVSSRANPDLTHGHETRKALQPPFVGVHVIAASFAINLLALALPLVLLQIFDRVVPNNSHDTLAVLFVGLIIALVLDFALKVCRIILLGHASESYETVLSEKVIDQMLMARSHAFSDIKSGVHLDRFMAIAQLRDHYGGQGRLLAIDLPFAVLFLAFIALIGGPLVFVPLIGLAVLLLASQVLRKLQRPALADRQSIDQRRHSFIMEALGQIITVKSQAMEAQMIRRYELLQSQSASATEQLARISGLSQTFGAIFGQVSVGALAGFGALLVMQGHIGIAELAACMLLNGRTIQPILKILSLWVQVEAVISARKKLNDVADLPVLNAPSRGGAIGGHIRFSDVGINVRGTDRVLFEGLSFEIKAGSTLAVHGSDGSGKSTLMRLILGEQVPDRGLVEIDGESPVNLIGCRGINQISYVDQEPAIFAGTILENLSVFGDAGARNDAIKAAESIGLAAEINRLPLGYDTVIGGGNSSASAVGFLQRISIARVLALEPRILLFNEANTALDLGADKLLRETLERLRGNTTIVLVSRRPSFLSLADAEIDLADYTPTSKALADWENDALQDGTTAAGKVSA